MKIICPTLLAKLELKKAFMSCHSYNNEDYAFVHVEILAPKGTKAAYVEPFSTLGNGYDRDWNGTDKQSGFSFEQETTLQRNTEFRIIDAKINENKAIHLVLAVIGQH